MFAAEPRGARLACFRALGGSGNTNTPTYHPIFTRPRPKDHQSHLLPVGVPRPARLIQIAATMRVSAPSYARPDRVVKSGTGIDKTYKSW